MAKTLAMMVQILAAASVYSASIAADQTSSQPAVGIRARSAKRGMTILPSVMPMPNTASTSGRNSGPTRVTSSSVLAR